MKKIFVILISLAILPAPVFAMDSSGNYAVWGIGKKACFGYQQASAKGEIDNFKDYMKGFLTAYNIFTEKTYSISGKMDENQILEWIESYCEDNPMSSFEAALTNFTFDHYEKRMKSTVSRVGR